MLKKINIVSAAAFFIFNSGNVFSSCEAIEWFNYKGTQLWKFPTSDVYFYKTKNIEIDADGAPNAYHKNNIGIDNIANAGYPKKKWKNVLVVDPLNKNIPYEQKDGEFKGYFLSKTSFQNPNEKETNPNRYVDSRKVPYIALPEYIYQIKGTGKLGDFVISRNISNAKETSGIFADIANRKDALGEVSIKLAEDLGGGNVNPINGANKPVGEFVYIIFPESKSDDIWELNQDQINARTNQLLMGIGGWEKISECLK